MTQLEELLREVPVPASTRAREEVIATARAETSARHLERARRAPRRLLTLAVVAIAAAAALLTPPGRAASAWVGKLVGIGEVGGSPTQERRGFDEPGTAVVVDNGYAPDGSRYEWVAYECRVDLRDQGVPTQFRGIGLSLDWPGATKSGGGGSCGERAGSEGGPAFGSYGVHIVPTQPADAVAPDLVISGWTGPAVHDVRVRYTDPAGTTRDLPVEFARVDGALRELARRDEPLGTFVAFIPGHLAARDELASRLDLRALTGTGDLDLGPIGREERAAARRAHRACEHLQPGPSDPIPSTPEGQERELRPFTVCLKAKMPASPIEYVAYDEQGREVQRSREPLIAAGIVRPRSGPVAGGEAVDAKRAERPTMGNDAIGEPTVLGSARAPDGALFETYAQRVRGGGVCVQHWWPFVPRAGARGFCGPGFPPLRAFGRPTGKPVAARPFGFLTAGAPATRHRFISGYARPNVTRVRLIYGDGEEAPVTLVRGAGERLGSDVGYWIAFLPPGTGRHTPIDVIAYARDRELSRYRYHD